MSQNMDKIKLCTELKRGYTFINEAIDLANRVMTMMQRLLNTINEMNSVPSVSFRAELSSVRSLNTQIIDALIRLRQSLETAKANLILDIINKECATLKFGVE